MRASCASESPSVRKPIEFNGLDVAALWYFAVADRCASFVPSAAVAELEVTRWRRVAKFSDLALARAVTVYVVARHPMIIRSCATVCVAHRHTR